VAAIAALLTLGGCGGQHPAGSPPPGPAVSGTAASGPAASGSTSTAAPPPSPAATGDTRVLRDLAPNGIRIGSSVVGGGHLAGTANPDPFATDDAYRTLLATQFSSLTPENAMKWESLEPKQGVFDFTAADAVVDFALQHGQQVRGHNLMWYQQNPTWLTTGTFTKAQLSQILHTYISTVVGHFKGKITAWDVANEIFDDNGNLRQGNPFTDALGIGAVADAFRWAHQADPDAVLYLNDYGLEDNGVKVNAYLTLVTQLQTEGVPIGGMGFEGHLSLEYSFSGLAAATNMTRFTSLGLDVAITELDVRIPLKGGTPTDAQLAQQADYFRQAVQACLTVDRCRSVTFWGSPDPYSWVPSTFPGNGAATMFATVTAPKPAFTAVADTLAADAGR